MKKMKKLISLAMAFCLIASSLCVVYAEDSEIQWNDVPAANGNTAYKWAVVDTTLYLDYYGYNTGASGNTWATVEEYQAGSTDADKAAVDYYQKRPWQDSASTITDIVITGHSTKVGRNTFRDMAALKNVTLDPETTFLDDNAFMNCKSLGPDFVVPATITDIDSGALMNTNIVSLIFAETTKAIDIENLTYMGRLRNITVMRPVTIKGGAAIDMKAFGGTYSAGIYGMTNPAKINVLVTDKAYFEAFKSISAYPDAYTIASSEMSVGIDTFKECTVIDKGQTVTFVTDVADKLSHMLYTENNGELTVELLAYVTQDGTNIAPDKQVHTALATNKADVKKFVFSTGFTSTGNRFGMDGTSSTTPRYPNVKEVVLPITLVHIGDYSFYNMTNLSKVNFEDAILSTGLGTSAFQYCPIETVILPSTCTKIYNYVFADNPALDTVYLPVTTASVVRAYSFGATTASTGSTAYAGKNVKVILDGVYTLGESGSNSFNKNVFQDQSSVVTDYRTTTLIYDSSEWSTAAPSLLDVTPVADKYYNVSENDGKANLFMYSFDTTATQPYKLFAGIYDGISLSSATALSEGTYTGGTILNNKYDVAVDTGKTARVFLWDRTSLKPFLEKVIIK